MVCAVTWIDGQRVWECRKRPLSLSRRAIEQRVARRLRAEGLVLRKCSPRSRWYSSLGDYYLCRESDRFLQAAHQDLDNLARELGVLSEGQAIADD